MRASVLIIMIMVVVAWMLAIPLLILLALDAITSHGASTKKRRTCIRVHARASSSHS